LETVLGKYELRAIVASGSRSTVYEGWDTTISRRVAVKKMSLSQAVQVEGWQDLARFRREAQAAARLQHPNIVGIFDYGETDNFAYIVMEFVEGGTLESALAKGMRFPISVIGRLMSDILAGLEYCHQRGVVHRDIKPSNIMVSQDGHAKIADFGLARLDDSNLTQIGMVMGTPAFMSPEQFRGGVTDWRTDIYSAGVILYVLLTGERPFDGGLATIMHKALNTDPPKPSQLSAMVNPSVDGVVVRAMAKRPDQRFQSAKEFADTLAARLGAPMGRQGLVGRRLPAALPRRKPQAVSQLALILGAIVFGVAGVTAALVYRPWASHRIAHSNSEAHSLPPPQATNALATPAISESPRSEQPSTGSPTPIIENAPVNEEAKLPVEPTDITAGAVPNQLQGVSPQEAQPSGLPPSIEPPTTPALVPLAPQIVSPTPSAATLGPPQSVRRGEVKGPGPRIRKVPAAIANEAAPPSIRPNAGAKSRTDHEDAGLVTGSAGGQDKNAKSSAAAVEQEQQLPKPVPFGRYEIRNGQRVFVPSN
jgi:eukaryotic-like serine/threonine-protein kinase